MKKVVSVVFALVMVFALGTVAFAENADCTFNIPVYYVAVNEGSVKPAINVKLVVGDCATAGAPSFKAKEVTLNFAQSTETEDVQFAEFTVDASTLTKPGKFVYNISQETIGDEDYAGLSFDESIATLTVYVKQGATAEDFTVSVDVKYDDAKINGGKFDGEKYVKVTEGANKTTEAGSIFTNTYSAASKNGDSDGFAVSKVVTGDFGDKTMDFAVTVKFTSEKKVALPITYTLGGEDKTVTFAKNEDNKYEGTANITVKHGDTISFSNVPYGVAYSVVENPYEDYQTSYKSIDKTGDEDKTISATGAGVVEIADLAVEITNDNQSSVDTGVIFDYLPYVLILAFVAAAGVLFVVKKRKAEEY